MYDSTLPNFSSIYGQDFSVPVKAWHTEEASVKSRIIRMRCCIWLIRRIPLGAERIMTRILDCVQHLTGIIAEDQVDQILGGVCWHINLCLDNFHEVN